MTANRVQLLKFSVRQSEWVWSTPENRKIHFFVIRNVFPRTFLNFDKNFSQSKLFVWINNKKYIADMKYTLIIWQKYRK